MPRLSLSHEAARQTDGVATTKELKWAAVFVALLLSVTSDISWAADESLKAAVVYHPGQVVNLLVSFKESDLPFQSGFGRFELQGQPREGQAAFYRVFDVNRVTKLSDRECEFSGTVSDKAASGEYQLMLFSISASGLSRLYRQGPDFQAKIPIRIENPNRINFPDITSVTLRETTPGNK